MCLQLPGRVLPTCGLVIRTPIIFWVMFVLLPRFLAVDADSGRRPLGVPATARPDRGEHRIKSVQKLLARIHIRDARLGPFPK